MLQLTRIVPFFDFVVTVFAEFYVKLVIVKYVKSY